jgi:uncharacterized membrane protein
MEAYAEAKAKVFSRLGSDDLAVVVDAEDYCRTIADDLEARQLRVCHVALDEPKDAACAAFVREGRLVVRLDNVETKLCGVDELGIKGPHNVLNALVASAMALEIGVEAVSVIEGLEAFAGTFCTEACHDGVHAGHDDVIHEAGDNLAECAADDNTDGHVDDVALEGESLEFFKEGCCFSFDTHNGSFWLMF